MAIERFLVANPNSISFSQGGFKPSVAVFGVPSDLTCTYRPGSREGPNAIREAFNNIEIYSRKLGVDLESLGIEDVGDVVPAQSAEELCGIVESVTRELLSRGLAPAILGGEHLLTYGAYRAMPKGTLLLLFDAHLDLRDECNGQRLSHATFLKRLTEEVEVDNIICVGARAYSKPEWEHAKKLGLKIVFQEALGELRNMRPLFRSKGVYVSIDLDVLDPAFAPGVGNPEPWGITPAELFEAIYLLENCRIVGFDITELTPLYDPGPTRVIAAKLLAELAILSCIGRSFVDLGGRTPSPASQATAPMA